MNKFFIDSNIIIEGLKEKGLKKGRDILTFIFKNKLTSSYINEVVFSEVYYWLIVKNKIPSKEQESFLFDLISSFIFLKSNFSIIKVARKFILSYNLKPNDALILATCKYYNIPYLLSLDEDFKEACEKEGIVLIDSVEKLKEVLNKK